MKRLILFALAALPMMLNARAPQPQYPAYDVPAGITVAPAQGFVSVSGSTYPKGVSNIGLTFGRTVCKNPANTTPAKLYKDDFAVPAATTLVTSIDMQTQQTAGVLFKDRAWNSTGVYKIEIPEGMFCYSDETDSQGNPVPGAPVPAVNLMYEIYIGYEISPRAGLIDQLDVIYLMFDEADEVIPDPSKMNGSGEMIGMSFYKDNASASYELNYSVMDLNGTGKKNVVAFRIGDSDGIAQEFMEPGVFGLNIPAGCFKYLTYGPNHDTDSSDYIERANDNILVKYIIPNMPAPEIYPFTDEPQESFTSFFLQPSEDFFKSWFVNDKTVSYLYRVNEDGVVDDTVPVAELRPRSAYWEQGNPELTNEFELYLYDREADAEIKEIKPAPGTYCLHVAESTLNGMSQYMEFLNGDPFEYYYEVAADPSEVKDVEAVDPENNLVTVYNVAGVCVARDADKAVLGTIAKGLYIVNGKKVLVK